MTTLYKYRSLKDIKNIKYFFDIIENNRLYAATYKELQAGDEKEGIYDAEKNSDREILEQIRTDKILIGICSLSKCANNEHLWETYADKHKGIAVKVEIDTTTSTTYQPVKYGEPYILSKELLTDEKNCQEIAMEILTHKTTNWKEEKEARVFVPYNKKESYVDVKIKSIIAGRAMSNKSFQMLKKLVRQQNKEINVIKLKSHEKKLFKTCPRGNHCKFVCKLLRKQ